MTVSREDHDMLCWFPPGSIAADSNALQQPSMSARVSFARTSPPPQILMEI
jgi:hypothetical protein